MAGPNLSTCSPWATIDDLCTPCLGYDDFPEDLMGRMLQVASDLLFELSGRRYPGVCESIVRPCSQRIHNDASRRYSSSTLTVSCGCSTPRRCGCPRPSEITLGVEPLISIEEIKVDGAVLDPSLYRIDDYKYLVRLRDADGSYASWPCCQDILLPDTEPDTFSVAFTYGSPPPPAGAHAAAVYACELAMSCSPIAGAECRLPKRVQSLTRQGVSMILLDPMEFLDAGKLGIPEADAFISVYNPNHLRRSATAISPDYPERVRRINTGS